MKLGVPWWFGVLDILLCAGAFCVSYAAADVMSQTGWLNNASSGWLYPAYVVLSGILSWACYRSRRTISWILIAMLALSIVGLLLVCKV